MTLLLNKNEVCESISHLMEKLGCPEVPVYGDTECSYLNNILNAFLHLDGVIASQREEIESLSENLYLLNAQKGKE
jgi:hypothetical protein